MSYHLYHTDALVLGGTLSGEGSRTIALFTKEFGFLTALAQSVREERSKLRYGLQDFSYSEVALIRGREYWRLTHASLKENVFQELSDRRKASRAVGRIFALLRRLLAGEEKNEPLFTAVLEGLQFMRTKNSADMVSGIEIVLVLRILYLLGYIAPRGEFDPFLSQSSLWDESIISSALLFRTLAISEINNSLQQTQL